MRYDFTKVASVLKESMELIQARRAARGDHWKLKHDGSLLTEIDPANEEFLRQALTADGECFIGEESIERNGKDYLQQALQAETWVVDPIDGTAPFAHHLPLWGISLGYMVNGVIQDGAIALPDLGQCFLTDGGAVRMATGIEAPVADWQWHTLEKPEDGWNPGRMITLGQRFTRQKPVPFPNPLLTPGSAVHSLSCLLTNNAIAYIGHVKLWDIAGVLPMLCRLGFRMQLLDGRFMTENILKDNCFDLDAASPHCWALKDTFVCAQPIVHEYVRARL